MFVNLVPFLDILSETVLSFSESPIVRRKSKQIMVGNVPVGGDAPISVQSMTNTPTSDIEATVAQIESIQQAGADLLEFLYRLLRKQRHLERFARELTCL